MHSYPDVPGDRLAFVVSFDGPQDRWNPKNWTSSRRCIISSIACLGTFVATLNSAIFAPGIEQASRDLQVGEEVMKLSVSLFVLGFATAPLIWAPGSELLGRRWPLIIGMFGSSIFTIATATAKDVPTLLICRFLAGAFGASPLSVVPAVLSDLYGDVERRTAISLYALTVFVGPLAAPIAGAFISTRHLGWRWTLYVPAILGFFDTILLMLFTTETFSQQVLVSKAGFLRRETGNWAIHAEHEKIELDIRGVLQKYVTRPLMMLTTEPIVLLVSLYMSFIYALVYGLVGAYPFVFESVYGMEAGVAELPFVALIIGICIAVLFIIVQQRCSAGRALDEKRALEPEFLLFPPMVGAPCFAVGLFWFAWTGFDAKIHWLAPTASGLLTAFGLLCIFLPCFNYLVDTYLPLAASAVAANVMLRSAIAAGFPLFSVQMFENLGVQWAGTLFGCIAVAMIPIPFMFRIFGAKIRAKSRLLVGHVQQESSTAAETV